MALLELVKVGNHIVIFEVISFLDAGIELGVLPGQHTVVPDPGGDGQGRDRRGEGRPTDRGVATTMGVRQPGAR